MNKKVQKKEYTVNYYDIDYKRKALLTSIINYFQDIAVFHSHTLGLGIEKLYEYNTVWVLHKWEININKYPALYDTVTVKTWPESLRRFYAYRTFHLMDKSENELLGNASSTWFLIDINKRKPVRIPETFYNIYDMPKDSTLTTNEWELKTEIRTDNEMEFKVKQSDIDTNRHVNNVRYIDWALETVPAEVKRSKELKKLRAIYEKEISYGEMVRSVSEVNESNGKQIVSHILYGSQGERITLLESTWE